MILNLSYRQCNRLLLRYRGEGDGGLLHGGRGRPSNRKIPEIKKQEILDLLREHYSDYGPTLASEILEERHDILISRETLRGWQSDIMVPKNWTAC